MKDVTFGPSHHCVPNLIHVIRLTYYDIEYVSSQSCKEHLLEANTYISNVFISGMKCRSSVIGRKISQWN